MYGNMRQPSLAMLDDDILLKIFSSLGNSICMGAPPQPRAALMPLSTNVVLGDASDPRGCNEDECSGYSSQDMFQAAQENGRARCVVRRTTEVHCEGSPFLFTSPSVHSHYQEPALNSSDSSSVVSDRITLQALACTSQRLRRLVFPHCDSCVCTVPTLLEHVTSNMGHHMTNLDLHRCGAYLQDHHLYTMPACSSLVTLNLSNCSSLTSNCLVHLRSLTSLTTLDLSFCRSISPSGYLHLPTSIVHLNLSHMNEYRTPLFMHLIRMTALRHLDLTSSGALTTGLLGIEHLSQLTWLSVAECDLVNDNDRHAVSKLTELRSLDLSGTKATNKMLPSLIPLTQLTHINLEGCTKITESHIDWMRSNCVAPAWETVALPSFIRSVDPATLVLTEECKTPLCFSRNRRSFLSARGSMSFGSIDSASSGNPY